MVGDPIQQLLRGTFRDPQSDEPIHIPVRAIHVEDSLAGQEAELVAALGLGRRFAVVSDPITREVLGARVERALTAIGHVEPVQLADRPHSDDRTVERLRATIAPVDAVIAVGSGTINDLCKYAAHLEDKPYVVFGTAPSMNGYTSANAAITVDGLKRSLSARMPAGVFLDLAVLSAAPPRMIRSGLGDSLCRTTAQADWLLSHLLRGTAYREAPFALLAADEAPLFAEAAALLKGDLTAMRRLARTLVLSGLGMVIYGGSHPASQGEHLISHYIDMMGGPDLPECFHGEQIGVTTLTMARLQDWLLDQALQVRPTLIDTSDITAHFGAETGAACLAELRAKAVSVDEADRLNARLAAEWPQIRDRIAAVRRSTEDLGCTLAAAGAPLTAAALGRPAPFYRTAVRRARQIRSRYTFLDLAAAAGLLEIFAAGEAY